MLLHRQIVLQRLCAVTSWLLTPFIEPAQSFSVPASISCVRNSYQTAATTNQAKSAVAYKGFSLPVREFGVEVPVACWFPSGNQEIQSSSTLTAAIYDYRISVRRIGQMLAGWEFIPGFYAREFSLPPSRSDVAVGSGVSLPKSGPVIILAHGFLGSRFDLSHLGETLAAEGFTCFSAEYPESLAATYDRADGLDRDVINARLLKYLHDSLDVEATKFGVVGHSLGCRTVIRIGDETWARVFIAGGPRLPDGTYIGGNGLFISSMNDGLLSKSRFGGTQVYQSDIALLKEEQLQSTSSQSALPSRAAMLFDRPDAPNHISFLTESVNDAMIDFLAVLLPVAKALKIPVLDFDRYQVSRDSSQTAAVVHPLIVQYLKQEMMQA